ncbi:hypothetical protein FRB99_003676 [Tulasnella sp. 403]|nr:hypothetical protein FRB99_003676 [Tulasnella sp. 403]
MSFTYPHYASQSPAASFTAYSITEHMGQTPTSRPPFPDTFVDDDDEGEEAALEASSTASSHPRQRHHVQMGYGSLARASRSSLRSAHDHFQHHTETSPLLQPFSRPNEVPPSPVYDTDGSESEDSNETCTPNHLTWSTLAEEAKLIGNYSIPVLITQLLEYSLLVASVICIGHLGTVQLAASTLGSMTSSVTGFTLIIGMGSTLDALLPHAWGGPPSERKLVGLWTQRMAVVFIISLVPVYIAWHSSYAILIYLRQDPEVAAYASLYLRWLSMGLPAYSFNYLARKYYQSIGLLHIPSIIIALVAPLNAVLNYILVWGPGPFQAICLGYIGAPIATSISFYVIASCYLFHAWLWAPREAWFPLNSRESIRTVLSIEALGFLVKLGAAGVGQTATEWWSWELIGLAASLLGPVTLASQSVLLVSASTAYQLSFAITAAATVRLGNLIGAGNAFQAKVASAVSLFAIVGVACFNSVVFLIFRKSWAYMFNNDPEVVAMVARVLPLVALFQVGVS